MKAEHRHELHTNELAAWMGKLPQFLRKNYMQVIGIVLIIIGILSWGPFKRMKQNAALTRQAEAAEIISEISQNKMMMIQGQMQGMNTPDSLLITANKLEIAVEKVKKPLAAALMLIKRAEALRTALHFKPQQVDEQIIQAQIAQAVAIYQKAIEKAQGKQGGETFVAMANFGLALCAEETGDYTKAKEIYTQIVENPDFESTIFPAQADFRLQTMLDHQDYFTFVNAPKPPQPETPATITPAPTEFDPNTIAATPPPPQPVEETATVAPETE